MKYLIYISLVATLFGFSANAQETLQCTGGNCLTSGYEFFDSNSDLIEIGTCINGDCDMNGWDVLRLNGNNTQVLCADNSCYGLGFQEIRSVNGEIYRTRTCKDDGSKGSSDCLANGWQDEYFGASARTENVICEVGGCQNGFVVETIIDDTASLETEVAEKEALLKQKRQEFVDYVKTYKQPNQALNEDIIQLRKDINAIKAELREGPSERVIDIEYATCLAPGGCFTSGYTLN